MGILDSILSDDLVTLTDPDFFGEPAVYTPVGAGGAPVNIRCLALRDPLVPNGERAATKTLRVSVSADPNVGIPVKPVRNQDTITIAWNIGDTPAPYVVAKIAEQDAGGWVLELKGA